MILPTMTQTTPLMTSDRSLANAGSNPRSQDGGFAMFWAMEMPAETPWPSVQNISADAPAAPSVAEDPETEMEVAQGDADVEPDVALLSFAPPNVPAQPDDANIETFAALTVAVEEPQTPVPNSATPPDTALPVDAGSDLGNSRALADETSRNVLPLSAASSAPTQPDQMVERQPQQSLAAQALPRGDNPSPLRPATLAEQAANPAAGQSTVAPVGDTVSPTPGVALPDQPQSGITSAQATNAPVSGQTTSTAPQPQTPQVMPVQGQIPASPVPADGPSTPSPASLAPATDVAKATAVPLAPRPSALDPAARPSLRPADAALRELENVASSPAETRRQTQTVTPHSAPPATMVQGAQATAVPMFQLLGSGLIQQDDPADMDSALLPLHATSQTGSPMASTAIPYQMVARPNHPPVAHQLTEAFVRSEGGRAEIALNPEELGRVRFAMVTTDAGMTFAITTERPETADLIRRNLEDLAREFRQMGFENLSFSFEDAPQDQQSGSMSGRDNLNAAPEDTPAMPEPVLMKRLRSGLDLKL